MGNGAKMCPACNLRFEASAVFCQRDGTRLVEETPNDPLVGRVLLGQFHVESLIGIGGMGRVYRASQPALGRHVAVKVLHADVAKNPDAVRRFQREARVAAALDHPNLVEVILLGQLEDGSLYLVMELVEGRPLAAILGSGALPVPRALHLAVQIGDAVGAAHARGIVHRDIKPENILVVPRVDDPDFVKVLDFGIARLLWDEGTQMTQSGVIFGTARYISPEGAEGEPTDARSDVYGIGAVTYQMLSGIPPFDGTSPVAVLMKHIHEPAPELIERARHVPAPIADVVMRALAKNPDARYDDGREFVAALTDAAVRCGIPFAPTVARGSRGSFPNAPRASAPAPAPTMRHGSVATPTPAPTPISEPPAIPGLDPRRQRLGLALAGAFAIGAATVGITAAIFLRPSAPVVSPTDTLVTRAESALTRGVFVGDESVDSLTAQILALDPRDARARDLRRDAARRLRDDAERALATGDAATARARYLDARILSPDDPTLASQIALLDATLSTPDPSIVLVPSRPTAGEPATVEIVFPSRDAPILAVLRGRRTLAEVRASPGTAPNRWVAAVVFPSSGSHRLAIAGDESVALDVEVGSRELRGAQARVVTGTSEPPTPRLHPVEQDPGTIDWNVPVAPVLRPTPTEATPPPAATPTPPAPPVETAPTPPPAETAPTPPAPTPPPPPPEEAPPPPWTGGSVL